MIRIKSDREVALMREAGRIVGQTMDMLEKLIVPGVTTGELDREAAAFISKKGGIAAFKGYRGFPAHICTSINEQIVHGIPGAVVIKEGDILSVDIGVELDGFYGDAAMTFAIGKISKEAKTLIRVCRETLELAVNMLVPGNKLSNLCAAIQKNVEANGFSVIRKYVGHGIGHKIHEDPQIPNFAFDIKRERDVVFKRGMVLAVEPMISAGTDDIRVLDDGWTAATKDNSISAHFEHTIAVREKSGWILTKG
jgi:methionyl aminopeptidase